MQAVILAAGSGKRLRPLTNNRSKAMIPVAGVPIVGRVIEGIVSQGINDLIVVIKPDDRNIRKYLDDHFSSQARIQFATQQSPMGMGDALNKASAFIHDSFLLSACDNLVAREDLSRFIARYQRENGLDALLSLIQVKTEQIHKTAVVYMQGDRITGIIEKPNPAIANSTIASTPLYIFSPAFKDYVSSLTSSPRGEYELQEAISNLISDGAKVKGSFLSGRRTLTTADDLRELTIHYLRETYRQGHLPNPPRLPGVEIHSPVLIEDGAKVDPGCVIGPNVYIESGVQVRSGTRIHDGYLLRSD